MNNNHHNDSHILRGSLKNVFLFSFLIFVTCFTLFLSPHHNAYATIYWHNFTGGFSGGWSSNVWIENFRNVTVGDNIRSVGLNVHDLNGGGSVRVKVYDDSGFKNFTQENVHQAGHAGGWSGTVWIEKFTNNLGSTITINGFRVGYNTVSSLDYCRAKIFTDSSPESSATLIEESSSQPCQFPISLPEYNLTNGASVWMGFETNSSTINIFDQFSLPSGTMWGKSHTYGTGPSDMSGASADTFALDMIMQFHNATKGMPKNLISESNSTALVTGINQIPLNSNAIVPSSGNVWAGFEGNESPGNPVLFRETGHTSGTTLQLRDGHTYGTGPDPYGEITNTTLGITMNIDTSPPATFSISPTSGHVGQNVTMSGNHFTSSDTMTFTYSGSTITTSPSTVTTNSTGGFSGVSFIVPSSVHGSHTIQASDTHSTTKTATYSVTTSETFTPGSGGVGDTITILGHGFDGTKNVNFTFGGTLLTTTPSTVTTNSTGSFTGVTFHVPLKPQGTYAIVATDIDGNTVSQNFFLVNAKIFDSPSAGTFGDTIHLSGTGYGANKNMTIKFNSTVQSTTPTVVTTNSSGAFSGVTITEPLSTPGSYFISGTDTDLNFAQVGYDVVPAGLDHFVVTNTTGGLIGSQSAGVAFNIKIVAKDHGNLTETDFNTTVNLSNFLGSISPTVSGTFTAGVLSSQSVTLVRAGTDSITAQVAGKSGTSNSFTVNPSALDHFTVTDTSNGNISDQVASLPFNIMIKAFDSHSNIESNFTTTVSLTNGLGGISPTTSSVFISGVLTSQTVTLIHGGKDNITASSGGKTGRSNNFNVLGNIPAGGCGLLGCPAKQVNYTFHRTSDFRFLNWYVLVKPMPFNLECLLTNGTFVQHSKWFNVTSVNSFNQTAPVIPTDNAYVACYGSGPLLSFVSPGNSSNIVTSIGTYNNTFGHYLGVPIGIFFIVMAGSLANQRTGPIWIVIVMAMIGILSTIGFFTLDPGVWAIALILAMAGLFVGRKVF